MNVAEAEISAGNPNIWKIQEACMVAVHVFKEEVTYNDQFDLKSYLTLVRSWVDYQDCYYIVGRALWTLSTYFNTDLYSLQMLEDIMNKTLQSLSTEKCILLRICAVR